LKDNVKLTFSRLLENAADIFNNLCNKWHKQGLKFGRKSFTKSIERHSTIHSSDVIVATSCAVELRNEHNQKLNAALENTAFNTKTGI